MKRLSLGLILVLLVSLLGMAAPVSAQATATVDGTVTLQGGLRPAPDGYDIPLTANLYDSSIDLSYLNINTEPPLYSYSTIGGTLTLTGLDPSTSTLNYSFTTEPGTYHISLYSPNNIILPWHSKFYFHGLFASNLLFLDQKF